jgi:hypothetical protein
MPSVSDRRGFYCMGQPMADCDFTIAALPAYPIKAKRARKEHRHPKASTPGASALDPLGNNIRRLAGRNAQIADIANSALGSRDFGWETPLTVREPCPYFNGAIGRANRYLRRSGVAKADFVTNNFAATYHFSWDAAIHKLTFTPSTVRHFALRPTRGWDS